MRIQEFGFHTWEDSRTYFNEEISNLWKVGLSSDFNGNPRIKNFYNSISRLCWMKLSYQEEMVLLENLRKLAGVT